MENLTAAQAAHHRSVAYQWIVEGRAVKRAAIPNTPPPPGHGLVTGRVLAAAVCRSDIKEAHGRRPGLQTFGHEVVVEVQHAWAPPGRTYSFANGDRVILNPHGRVERSSGFATHFHAIGDVGELDRSLLALPSSVDTLKGVFVEPLACAISCVRVAAAALSRSASVLVSGAGLMGVLIASVIASRGHPTVLTNRSARRLEWAARAADPEVRVMPQGQSLSRQYDLIIDASAFYDEATCSALLGSLRDNGRFHVFAGTDASSQYRGVSVDDIRRKELVRVLESSQRHFYLTGSHRIGDEDFTESIRAIAMRGLQVDYASLVSRRVALDELPAVLAEGGAVGRTLVSPCLAPMGGAS